MHEVVVYCPHPALRVEESFLSMSSISPLVASSLAEAAEFLAGGAEIFVSPRWNDDCLTPNLRWIQSVASGVDAFPLELLKDHGVIVTSARHVSHEAMAEHALTLLLSLVLSFPTYAHQARRHEWKVVTHGTLADRTVGVLGLGAVGEALAQRLRSLGVTVIGTKRHTANYSGSAHEVFPPARTVDVCARSDAIVVCVPLDDSTWHLIGPEALAALGSGWVINVSRGAVIDEKALLDSLQRGRLAGAGLDVLEHEPLPADSAWWELPNVIITPHVAGKFTGYGQRLAELFVGNFSAFTGDGPWINRVV